MIVRWVCLTVESTFLPPSTEVPHYVQTISCSLDPCYLLFPKSTAGLHFPEPLCRVGLMTECIEWIDGGKKCSICRPDLKKIILWILIFFFSLFWLTGMEMYCKATWEPRAEDGIASMAWGPSHCIEGVLHKQRTDSSCTWNMTHVDLLLIRIILS